MQSKTLQYQAIKSLYPNEWVLLGNPTIKGANVLKGSVVHHDKDKKTVCEFAQKVVNEFEMIKIVFTGEIPKISKLSIFKVTEN